MNLVKFQVKQQKNLDHTLCRERQLEKSQLHFVHLLPNNKKDLSNSKFYNLDLLKPDPSLRVSI